MDLFDLEAAMYEDTPDPAWLGKVERARERVAAFNALPRHEQVRLLHSPCDRSCEDPEMIRIATRIPATIDW